MGGLPLALLLFVPRTSLSFLVIGVAMACRAVARLLQTASGYKRKANLRILIVTDYMPPQTHGIAVRFRQYIDYMRKAGHEVQVFCTDIRRDTESSFDHPNLPSIVNPYNVKNRVAYSSGIKLAWYLGVKQWDLVHLVCPSNIGWPVLPVAAWRRIPIYVSHHVDMKYYIYEYVKLKSLASFGYYMYRIIMVVPTIWLAQVNAAPTLTFLNEHLPYIRGTRKRIPSGVAHERFMVDSEAQIANERKSLLARCGLAPATPDAACIILMVQRLAPEKGTMRCLEALSEIPRKAGEPLSLDGVRPLHLVIAGDGPSRKHLEQFAATHALPVTFAGNLPNGDLPPLYRAADLFVTCSTSETFGLTVLESLACGTPAVLPHCGVFDELWMTRIPNEWIYDEGTKGSLLASLRHAGARTSKAYLVKNPVKASWEDATRELLAQYEETIEANLPARETLASFIGNLDSLMRAGLVSLFAWCLMRAYTARFLKMFLGVTPDLSIYNFLF
jgi:glycosyltransferase involved in cell wall biosynthesis